MKNLVVLLVVICYVSETSSQNNLEIGLSGSLIKFSDASSTFIGDKHLFLTPILNVGYKINKRFSLNAELSLDLIKDIGLISNSVNYTSFGGSVRYHFNAINKFEPYAFLGGTFVQAELKMTPTLNFGVGNSYMISNRLGINTQIEYKFSEDRFESMRSHFQFSVGVVYRFDIGNIFGRKSICETNGF